MNEVYKHLPNLLTVFNLVSGSLSIMFLFTGDFRLACWMVGVAAVFDFLDGFMARLLKAASEIGKVLDSLADMVSFGLAPGLIIYRLISMSPDVPGSIAFLALLIPAFSAVRLAQFSVDERQSDCFIGIPTPLNALMLASFPLILFQYQDSAAITGLFSNGWFLVAVTVVTSLMLVAPVGIMALKFKSFSWGKNQVKYGLVIFAILLVIFTGYLALPLIYLIYILLSIIETKFINH
jgi:CDP-diacylglycerol--serine O-phosphatidyltransferase